MTEAEQIEIDRQAHIQAGLIAGVLVVFLVWLAWLRGEPDKSDRWRRHYTRRGLDSYR